VLTETYLFLCLHWALCKLRSLYCSFFSSQTTFTTKPSLLSIGSFRWLFSSWKL